MSVEQITAAVAIPSAVLGNAVTRNSSIAVESHNSANVDQMAGITPSMSSVHASVNTKKITANNPYFFTFVLWELGFRVWSKLYALEVARKKVADPFLRVLIVRIRPAVLHQEVVLEVHFLCTGGEIVTHPLLPVRWHEWLAWLLAINLGPLKKIESTSQAEKFVLLLLGVEYFLFSDISCEIVFLPSVHEPFDSPAGQEQFTGVLDLNSFGYCILVDVRTEFFHHLDEPTQRNLREVRRSAVVVKVVMPGFVVFDVLGMGEGSPSGFTNEVNHAKPGEACQHAAEHGVLHR